MGFPISPPLGTLRLATLHDVPRIATVATAGFYYSPVFTWERRFHHQYPTDTFQSYSKMFADIIVDPCYIALVAEDLYDPAEGNKSAATIAPDRVTPPFQQGDSVIVGAATWKLDPDSRRIGQFVPSPNDLLPLPTFDGGKGRDKSPHHADMLDAGCDAAEARYFQGNQLVDMVVVHPAYWRRGHGTTLVQWGKSLADLDGTDQGVIAADMGEKLYTSLDYQKLDEVRVEDNTGSSPHDVSVGILKYYSSSFVRGGEL